MLETVRCVHCDCRRSPPFCPGLIIGGDAVLQSKVNYFPVLRRIWVGGRSLSRLTRCEREGNDAAVTSGLNSLVNATGFVQSGDTLFVVVVASGTSLMTAPFNSAPLLVAIGEALAVTL